MPASILTWVFMLYYTASRCNCNMTSFEAANILRFLRTVENEADISETCQRGLVKVDKFLTDNRTDTAQRGFYSASYGTGELEEFLTRKHDRWVYRGRQCLLVSGENYIYASKFPMHYCYAYNEHGPNAYGICIPSECFGEHDKLLLNWRNFSSPIGSQRWAEREPLTHSACTNSRHAAQWYENWPSMLEFAANVIIGVVAILASIYEVLGMRERKKASVKEPSRTVEIFLAFSLLANLKRLLAMPKDRQSTITCFFGIRFLSMVWTVIGHSFTFVQPFIENVQDFKTEMVENFWNQWITNFTLSVDTFFVLSGTLTAYTWFRKCNGDNKEKEPPILTVGYWLKFYRHRLIRLWPAYIFTLLLVTLRASITYHHPMWPPTDPAIQCPGNWWKNVLFINSLMDNRCMPWTWYIGTEFIFYLLSPIFLLSLRFRPNIGWALAIATITASCCLNTLCMIAYNFPPTQFLWRQPEIFNPDFVQHHMIIYIKPQYRIGPYIIGILLGYHMVGMQKRGDAAALTRRTLIVGWTFAIGVGFWMIFGIWPSLQAWDWPFYHLFYGTVHRSLFALVISWLIFACHFGYAGWINAILSARFLIPLSNLCYSVYLFHMLPVVFTYLLDTFPMVYRSLWPLFGHVLAQLVMSYFFGLICALFAELPALNIERILLREKARRSPADVMVKLNALCEQPMIKTGN